MSGHTIWKTFEYRSQVARAAPRLGGATVIVQGFYGGTCCLERRNEPEIPFSNVRGLVYSLGKTHYTEDFCREKQNPLKNLHYTDNFCRNEPEIPPLAGPVQCRLPHGSFGLAHSLEYIYVMWSTCI